jgi:hypothetical protein
VISNIEMVILQRIAKYVVIFFVSLIDLMHLCQEEMFTFELITMVTSHIMKLMEFLVFMVTP